MEIIKFLSLQNLDSAWQNTLAQSKLLAFIKKPFAHCTDKLQEWPQAKAVGLFLQTASFYLTVFLFACLPLPQFARDKEGLAGILIAAFLVWLSGILLAGKPQYRATAIDALIILFFAINIVSTCCSHYFSYSLHGLLKLLIYVLAYFLFSAQLANNRQRQIVLVITLLLTSTFVSLYGLYQYKIGVEPLATWEDPGIENQATRIYATFNNPNLLAGYLLPLIMLAASSSSVALYKRKLLLGSIAIAITGLLTTALILTGSRGAYLGVAAGFLGLIVIAGNFVWRQSKRNRWLLIAAAAIAFIIAAMIFHRLPGFEQRLISIFAGREHSSNSFRLNVWLSCLAMFKDNWLTGIGVGNQAFRLAYGLYMRSGYDALAAYSVPLEVAVESGIFALLCFGLIIVSTLFRAHIVFWNNTNVNSVDKALVVGAALALTTLFVHGLVDTVFFRPPVQFIFFLLLAMLATAKADY